MSGPLLDRPGYDTWLARTLLDGGRLDLRTLQGLLAEARHGRRETLARLVEQRGLLEAGDLERVLQRALPGAERPPLAERVAQHRLEHKLGEGAMGSVFLGVHEATGAKRAIKIMTPQSPEAILRFRREGEALAQVDSHRNVVRVHDLGQTENALFLVMDYAAGGSLADRLQSGPLEPEEAARVVAALARGLAHVHGSGILHRDLKPGNVLFDEVGTPKLVDFGLAKLAWEGSLTASGAVLGTPSFMAPEQVTNSSSTDELSDVYGLGAVLYACLTARAPFGETSILLTLNAVLQEAPAPPSSVSSGIPPWLESICLAALSKDPARRPASAAALAEALEQRTGLQPSRGRAWALLGALGLLPLILLLAHWATKPGERPLPPPPRPSLPPAEPTAPPTDARLLRATWPVDWDPAGLWTPELNKQLKHALRHEHPPEQRLRELEALVPYGHPKVLREYGVTLLSWSENLRNPRRVIRYLQLALKHGRVSAASDLAAMYAHGERSLPMEAGVRYARYGELAGLPNDLRLAAALAFLGTGQSHDRGKELCERFLDQLSRRRVSVPTDPGGEEAAYAIARNAFEPRSEHWPEQLSTWPVSTNNQFSAEEHEHYDRADPDDGGRRSLDLESRYALLLPLARRNHCRALRRLSRLVLLGGSDRPSQPGRAVHLLWAAVKHGSSRAAKDLALLYAPPELQGPLGINAYEGCREVLAIEPNLKVVIAGLMTVGSNDPQRWPSVAPLVDQAMRLMPPGASRPTPNQAYAFLEEHWEPRARQLARARILRGMDEWLAEELAKQPDIRAEVQALSTEPAQVLYEQGRRSEPEAERGDYRRSGVRLVALWREAYRKGYVEALSALFSSSFVRGRASYWLTPPPPDVFADWLFELAERGQWRASRALALGLSNPEAVWYLEGPGDAYAASAWLAIAKAQGIPPRELTEAKGRLESTLEELPPLPADLGKAWRRVRQSWPRKLR